MRKTRFTEEQIAMALRQGEVGTPVAEIIRKLGISEQTYYRWKRKYGPTPNRWTVKCLCFLSSPKSLWSQKLPLRRRRRGVAACPAR